jgi:tetratricopeptide (TPR) repeat protein
MVYYTMGDFRTTQRYCQLALAIHQKTGYREGEAFSLMYMGHAQLGLDHLDEAATHYDQALRLRRDLEQPGPAIDVLAGQADIALKQTDMDRAVKLVDEITGWLESNDTAGVDNPLRVYFTTYRVLEALGQDDPVQTKRARTVVNAAYTTLQEQAANLRDNVLRRLFLQQVKLHQDIVSAWEAQGDV